MQVILAIWVGGRLQGRKSETLADERGGRPGQKDEHLEHHSPRKEPCGRGAALTLCMPCWTSQGSAHSGGARLGLVKQAQGVTQTYTPGKKFSVSLQFHQAELWICFISCCISSAYNSACHVGGTQ